MVGNGHGGTKSESPPFGVLFTLKLINETKQCSSVVLLLVLLYGVSGMTE